MFRVASKSPASSLARLHPHSTPFHRSISLIPGTTLLSGGGDLVSVLHFPPRRLGIRNGHIRKTRHRGSHCVQRVVRLLGGPHRLTRERLFISIAIRFLYHSEAAGSHFRLSSWPIQWTRSSARTSAPPERGVRGIIRSDFLGPPLLASLSPNGHFVLPSFRRTKMLLRTVLVALALLVSPAFATFGITVSGKYMTVDTAGGLIFTGVLSSCTPSSRY